ncbi:MAG: molybdopterin-synthase adenylyltransferase MoeB [Myxococcales bacterium]|nr:molybdopterin-synthase adenylyltransferase MoeB [Myxococcales bacterium]
MAKSFADLMSETRRGIREVSLEALKERIETRPDFILVDVREGEEFRAGHIPGALHIARGHLESKVESLIGNKDAPIVLYCAGGTRSALAARTLAELGYTQVESANPGFVQWKDRRYPMVVPRVLTGEQRDRYSRHLLLPEVGEKGQAALLDAKVLLLGAGGLGSPSALYLAAAGVGTLGIVDPDTVDASNLQRQVIHATSRVGQPKVDSAEFALRELNPDVKVVKYQERLTSENIDRIFEGYDVIVDGCDNFPTRYLVNDASVMKNKPVVHGSIFRFEGQVTTFVPRVGPCYRCLYPQPPPPELAPSCQEAGVLGVLPGIIGVIQATEAIKLILKKGQPLVGRLLTYDSLGMKFRELKLRRDKECPMCGEAPSITGYIDYEHFCTLG